jgi:hypothetical protein
VTRPHTVVLAVVALAVAVSTAGCTSVTEDAANPPASVAQATSSPGPDTPASGGCRFIDGNQAAEWLGATPTPGGTEPVSGGLVRVDGCSYKAATASFGYAVDDYSAADKTATEDLESLRGMAPQLSDEVLPVTVPGADASLAFASLTSSGQHHVQLFFVEKSYLVGIGVVMNDKAAATAIAQNSAAILLDAVS